MANSRRSPMLRSGVLAVIAALGCAWQSHGAADTSRHGRTYSHAMAATSGAGGMLSRGGTASVNDLSAAEANPAGLALSHEFSGWGSVSWRDDNIMGAQVGALDSFMSEISAGMLAHQTTKASGGKDRRYTLGLAERVSGSPLLIGVGGDYAQLEPTPEAASRKSIDVIRLRLGAIYAFNDTIAVGVRSEGYLDKMRDKEHAAGVAVGVAEYYLLNADVIFTNKTLSKYLGGVTLSVKEYLDLRASYGYELGSSQHFGAAGITLKSQQFRLFYAVTKSNLRNPQLDQSVGASLAVSM